LIGLGVEADDSDLNWGNVYVSGLQYLSTDTTATGPKPFCPIPNGTTTNPYGAPSPFINPAGSSPTVTSCVNGAITIQHN
jgi:hypothetical protein